MANCFVRLFGTAALGVALGCSSDTVQTSAATGASGSGAPTGASGSGVATGASGSGAATGASGRSAATGTSGTGLVAAGVGSAGTTAVAGASGMAAAASGSGGVTGSTAAMAGTGTAAGSSGAPSEPGAGGAGGGTAADSGAGGTQIAGGSGGNAGASGSASPTGTFPAVSDLSAKGPFTAVTVQNTGPSNGYTLFYPMQAAPEGVRNPVVAWGNGGATTPGDYDYLLPHLATHGFVVIASDNPLVTGADVRSGLDWVLMQNDSASSPLRGRLDTQNVAGMGYSNGGLAILSAADDPRFVTLVIISGASTTDSSRSMNIPKLHTPTAYFCTADSASSGNCAGDYAVIKVPAFYGVMNGSTHTDVTELLGLGKPEIMKRLAGAATGWLRWQQMQDSTRKAMFLGSDCQLCTDPGWKVEAPKNWP